MCKFIKVRQLASIEFEELFQPNGSTAARQASVEVHEKQNSSYVLTQIRDYMFGLSFLTTLDIWNDYFKGSQSVDKLHKC